MSPNDNEPPAQPTATGDNEPTAIVQPPTVAASDLAWSLDGDGDTATSTPRSWRSVGFAAGVGVLGAVVAASVITAIGMEDKTGSEEPPGTVMTDEMQLPPPPAPSTVTVTAAPLPTVTVEANPSRPSNGRTDVFIVCPDGHEGVIGGHTTCAFAENVRRIFYATGMANNFTAFSPVTGRAYQMTCVGRYPAYFTDGSMMISTRCYGGDNAEVIIW
ncbi:hypothetical protein MML61_26015 [Mycobacterium marinum]|uniref:hypothetical protein n=1 Tax=Mycobacterium marinum TaxID=1781 RepID=UPI0023594F39|nr:hypothetical protein [Mycobacterium marinum]WCS18165.1 hypothetical protein MML61_26015 [Mycobacterium marinum]